MGAGDRDDEDRDAILARRKRFIAAALVGMASAACDDPSVSPAPCLEAMIDPSAGQGPVEPTPPTPLGPTDPKDPNDPMQARPRPCLEVSRDDLVDPDPPDEEGEGDDATIEGRPRACLRIAPPPRPGAPRPCLSTTTLPPPPTPDDDVE